MSSEDELKSPSIEGVYHLIEERNASGSLFPPEIRGRFVMLNGTMILIFSSRAQSGNGQDIAQFGNYKVDGDIFSYCWEYRSSTSRSQLESVHAETLTFQGDRLFHIKREPGAIRFLSEVADQSEFRFLSDRLEFFESGNLARIWRRA